MCHTTRTPLSQVRQYFRDSSFYAADVNARGFCGDGFSCEGFSASAATVKVCMAMLCVLWWSKRLAQLSTAVVAPGGVGVHCPMSNVQCPRGQARPFACLHCTLYTVHCMWRSVPSAPLLFWPNKWWQGFCDLPAHLTSPCVKHKYLTVSTTIYNLQSTIYNFVRDSNRFATSNLWLT